jgi:PAS domain S-box-containing protein
MPSLVHHTNSPAVRSYGVWGILGLALIYAGLGCLSLLLAVPPSYSIIIFPPAGIALGMVLTRGYQLLPGVFLGSFAISLVIFNQHSPSLTWGALVLSACLAFGSTLQAGVSSYMIRRTLNYQLALDTNRSILQFFLLGGLFGCMIAASIGVTTLYLMGSISGAEIQINWATWWMGDLFGVLTATPIVLIFYAQPRAIWYARRWSVLIPLTVCLMLVIVAFGFIRHREEQKMHFEFRLEAERISQHFQSAFDSHTDAVKNIERFFASSGQVTRQDFTSFLAYTLKSHQEITYLAWLPMVKYAQRAEFEHGIAAQGFTSPQIKQHNDKFELINAKTRDEYFPVTYLAPFEANQQVFLFDMAAMSERRQAIEQARDDAELRVTEPFSLMLQTTQRSVTLFAPIYEYGKPITTIAQRRAAFKGVAASTLVMDNLINSLLTEEQKKSISLKFYDPICPNGRGLFYNNINMLDQKKMIKSAIHFGGKEYVLITQPSDAYLKSQATWITWLIMVGELLFSGLLSIYLLMSTAHMFRVEGLVTRHTVELKDREERLAAILGNAGEGILTADRHGKIESANQSAEVMLSYPHDGLLGRGLSDLFQDSSAPDFLTDFLNHPILTADTADHANELQERRQMLGKRRYGGMIPVELVISRIELGGQALFIIMLHDLTEKKRAEKLKNEFVSAVSHELRTPLTSIRGVLGLLVGGVAGVMPEKSVKMLNMAHDNAIRLTNLINDLLDFERLEYGAMPFNLAPTHLQELLEQAVQSNQGYAQNYGRSLNLEPMMVEPIIVDIDSQRFSQVLSNLFSNAIKFSKEKGRVDVRLRCRDKHARIEVQDYGIGISENFKKRIFQKFSQEDAKTARKYAGTGLGLSLSKSMVEKMHGTIGFTSIEHQGSIFYIELPLLNNHSTASNPSAKTPAHITLCNSDPAQPSQRASDDTKSAQ